MAYGPHALTVHLSVIRVSTVIPLLCLEVAFRLLELEGWGCFRDLPLLRRTPTPQLAPFRFRFEALTLFFVTEGLALPFKGCGTFLG